MTRNLHQFERLGKVKVNTMSCIVLPQPPSGHAGAATPLCCSMTSRCQGRAPMRPLRAPAAALAALAELAGAEAAAVTAAGTLTSPSRIRGTLSPPRFGAARQMLRPPARQDLRLLGTDTVFQLSMHSSGDGQVDTSIHAAGQGQKQSRLFWECYRTAVGTAQCCGVHQSRNFQGSFCRHWRASACREVETAHQ